MANNRAEYQHRKYLERKYAGLSEAEIRIKQREETQRRAENRLKEHRFWMNREFKKEQNRHLAIIFSNKSYGERERVCVRVRSRAFRLLAEYEKMLKKTSIIVEENEEEC